MKISAISILAGQYEQPIADLVFKLAACRRNEEYPLLPTYREVSYSITVSVLLVMMLESYVARMQYRDIASKRCSSALRYLENIPRFSRKLPRLKEIFVLRDAIAHNHVHEYDQLWSKEGVPRESNFDLDDTWQAKNPKYASRVIRSRRRPPVTKLLRLNVLPTMICKSDVQKVFSEVNNALVWLHKRGHLDIAIGKDYVQFVSMKGGKETRHLSFSFWALAGEFS